MRHELLLLLNGARGAFSGWSNLLTLLVAAPVLVLVTRAWFNQAPADRAGLAMALLGFATGVAATHLLVERVQYHQTLGMLVEEALAPRPAFVSFATLLAMAVIIAAGPATLLYPSGLGYFLAAALAGIAARGLLHLAANASLSGRNSKALPRVLLILAGNWRSGAILGLAVGFMAATGSMLLAEEASMALALLLVCISALARASLDAGSVRFMAQSGFSPWQAIRKHSRALVAFGCTVLPIYALTAGLVTAVLAGGIVLLILLVMIARLLCYRLYPKRLADFTVSIILITTVLAGIAVPLLTPIVFALPIVRLWNMASVRTWQIA
jgi:hypothetical protein